MSESSRGKGRRGEWPSWRRVLIAWAPAAGYMLLIWLVSSMSDVGLPMDQVPWRDKGVHFVEYAVLGLLVAHGFRHSGASRRDASAWLWAVVVTSLWGVIDEIHQAFVPGRTAELADLGADVLGALAGCGAWWLVKLRPLRAGGHATSGTTPERKT